MCGQHGQTFSALGVYEWMKALPQEGGAGLCPSVYTYTAAMRAALAGNVLEKALQIWNDVEDSRCLPDSRLCTAYIEVGPCSCLLHSFPRDYTAALVSIDSIAVFDDTRVLFFSKMSCCDVLTRLSGFAGPIPCTGILSLHCAVLQLLGPLCLYATSHLFLLEVFCQPFWISFPFAVLP